MTAYIHALAAQAAPGALPRAIMAGAAWGVMFAIGLTAINAYQCGGVCVRDALFNAAVSVAAGIVTIGPLAAFGRKANP